MVVEDHTDSRELMCFALESVGAAVVAFERSEPAMTAIEQIRPSIIVADIGLPEEDGDAFIRRVRRHSAESVRSVPALAVTAYATVADEVSAIQAGFQSHLAKPFDPQTLVNTIHELVRKKASH